MVIGSWRLPGKAVEYSLAFSQRRSERRWLLGDVLSAALAAHVPRLNTFRKRHPSTSHLARGASRDHFIDPGL